MDILKKRSRPHLSVNRTSFDSDETVLVREYPTPMEAKAAVVKALEEAQIIVITDTSASMSSYAIKKPRFRVPSSITVDFGGMLPSEQEPFVAEIGKIDHISQLKGAMRIKDGPFSASAKAIEKKLMG